VNNGKGPWKSLPDPGKFMDGYDCYSERNASDSQQDNLHNSLRQRWQPDRNYIYEASEVLPISDSAPRITIANQDAATQNIA